MMGPANSTLGRPRSRNTMPSATRACKPNVETRVQICAEWKADVPRESHEAHRPQKSQAVAPLTG